MPSVHLTLDIQAVFDPHNKEWKGEMRPIVHAVGTDEGDVKTQPLMVTHYITGSLPELFSAMETIAQQAQRAIEDTNEVLKGGGEFRSIADPAEEEVADVSAQS